MHLITSYLQARSSNIIIYKCVHLCVWVIMSDWSTIAIMIMTDSYANDAHILDI